MTPPTDPRLRPPSRRLLDRDEKRWNNGVVTFDVGRYPDGSPCEVFINIGKEGTQIQDLMGCTSILASILLQKGFTAEQFREALRGFSPESLPGLLSEILNAPTQYRRLTAPTPENTPYETP
jgi:hypothetical protein